MTPLIKRFSFIAFILCMMMISCKAYANHYFFEVAVTTDTYIAVPSGDIGYIRTNTLARDYGDSLSSVSNISLRTNNDTVFTGVTFHTDSTLDVLLANGYDTITCEGAVNRAKTLFGFSSIKYICD